MESVGEYPDDWDEIATRLKSRAGWHCERCGHKHEWEGAHVLTVHHLIPNKDLCEDWNLAVLCQRCHLSVQARVNMYMEVIQGLLMDRPDWLTPHVIGCRDWLAR